MSTSSRGGKGSPSPLDSLLSSGSWEDSSGSGTSSLLSSGRVSEISATLSSWEDSTAGSPPQLANKNTARRAAIHFFIAFPSNLG